VQQAERGDGGREADGGAKWCAERVRNRSVGKNSEVCPNICN